MDFKALRAAKNKKAQSMIESSGGKVDSSTFTPAEKLNADAKTGMRPISRRAFKVGGKVEGVTAKSNLSRTPRMNGGKIGLANTDQKTANEERDGVKHVGGFKKGGMVKNFEGSAKDKMQDKKLAGNRKMTMPEWEASKADAKHDKQQSMKNLKKSPRIGKALGGSFTPLQMQQMQGGMPPEQMAQMQQAQQLMQQAQQQQQQMGQMQLDQQQQMTGYNGVQLPEFMRNKQSLGPIGPIGQPIGMPPLPVGFEGGMSPNGAPLGPQVQKPYMPGMPPNAQVQIAPRQFPVGFEGGMMGGNQRNRLDDKNQRDDRQRPMNPMRPPQQAQPMGGRMDMTGGAPMRPGVMYNQGPTTMSQPMGTSLSKPPLTGSALNAMNVKRAGGFKSGGKVAEAHVKGCMCKACGGSAGYKDGGGLVAQGERMKNGSTGALDARDSKMADRTARMEEQNSDKTAKREEKDLERNSRDAAKIVKKEGRDTAREQAQAVRQKPMGGGQQRPMPMGGNQRPMGGGQSPVPVAQAPRNIAQPMATRVPRPAAIGMGKPTPPNRTAPVRTADGVGDGTGSGGMGFIKKAPKKPYTGATGFKAGGSTEKAHVKGCMCKACGGSAGMKDGGGLYANINAKRERIENGSNEKMRKVGSKGAPDAQDFRDSAKTAKKEDGGRIARATGGRTKGTTNISINVMPHNANNPENGIDSQMPPPMMPPAGGPPPMAPPPPPMGGGVPPGLGDAMASAAGLPPAGGIDPMMGRKSGGKVYPKMQYGSGGGKGRLEKIDEYGKNA